MKKYFLFIAAILILGSSCKKDFLSVNEINPNTAASVPGNLILPAALSATANIMNTPRNNFDFIFLFLGHWSVSASYAQPSDYLQYNITNTSGPMGNFTNFLLAAKAFDDIEKASTTPQQAIYLGIAKIMKAYIFTNMVDMWGNVPYSEAFKGAANFKPKYDDAKAIYEDCVLQIEAAVAAIKAAPVDVVKPTSAYDLVYAGDVTKWIKFANTLKLRILLHQSGMTGRDTYIKAAIAKISGGYIGADEGAMIGNLLDPSDATKTLPFYIQSAGKMSPLWQNFYAADGTTVADGLTYDMAGSDAIDMMWNNIPGADWRIFAFYKEYSSKYDVGGNYFGAKVLNTASVVCQLGPGLLKGYNQSSIILSDYESLFLQAEAAQRGYIGTTADARTYYYNALKANYKFLGLTGSKYSTIFGMSGTDYESFLSSNATEPLINFDIATDKLKTIMTQKWVSLNGNTPIEVWTDWRRTGLPDFLHWSANTSKLNPTPPVRLPYPQREVSTNGENVALQGVINIYTSKIFWQK